MANTLQPLPEQLKPAAVAAKRAASASSRQFKDFGLLDAGKQSKASTATAIVINVLIVALVIVLSVTAKKTLDARREETMLIMPVVKPLPPPEPKILHEPPPPTPPVVKVDPPKIKLPDVKPIEAPKPAEVKMTQPAPVVTPAAPKKVVAPPAPVVVSLAHPMAASVVNNSPHPTAVALGSANNPIAPSNRPAVSAINLGQKGLAGMPASNTGGGPAATAVNLGSGSPGGQQMTGNGVRPVQGVKLGVAGGTGPMNSTGHTAGQVNLGQVQQVSLPKPGAAAAPGVPQNTPKVIYKPKPVYTAEATALHINGVVQVRIRVSATGAVTVLQITRPLGHGLDQSAEHAAQAMRFQPAVDANGHPVDWEGNVTVTFQSESNG
ncbi:energy transducer TonB [Granulicella aggregans]|jgi:TonB family protein|uniref:energy transducer TonB n=1 Tax=Granulicella aggregans TaxID=474949 RepID=UPI0021DF8DDC|nr:energy transducer TonB [Granulicella aggregans]